MERKGDVISAPNLNNYNSYVLFVCLCFVQPSSMYIWVQMEQKYTLNSVKCTLKPLLCTCLILL